MEKCGDRPLKCVICAGPHKVEDYCCGVIGCNKKKKKICDHVTAKCANCGKNHTANSLQRILRHIADIEVRQGKNVICKKRKQKTQVEDASEARNIRIEETSEPEKREESLPVDTEMDLENENWTQYAEAETPRIYIDESQNYTKKYQC